MERHELLQLLPAVKMLQVKHKAMVTKTEKMPFYGNDTVKHCLEELFTFSVFDHLTKIQV